MRAGHSARGMRGASCRCEDPIPAGWTSACQLQRLKLRIASGVTNADDSIPAGRVSEVLRVGENKAGDGSSVTSL